MRDRDSHHHHHRRRIKRWKTHTHTHTHQPWKSIAIIYNFWFCEIEFRYAVHSTNENGKICE
jgi:hypothetical protein